MNTLRNLLLALAVLNWINLAGPITTGQQTQTAEVETLLATAQHLYNQKNFDEALTNCLKASRLNPQDHRPYLLAGLIYMKMFKMKSASEAFANAIRLQPDSKELYLLKASADDGRGATDEAVAACRKALEIALAKEMEEYRKNYVGGLQGIPANLNQ